MRVRIS